MANEITTKRGLFILLVIATMAVFVGLVWLIARYVPWSRLNTSAPSPTTGMSRVEANCTYPVAYWRQHPELYPSQVVLGSKTYHAGDISEILSSVNQGTSTHLQAQLVGAFLNLSSGADQAPIENAVFQAFGWLEKHPDGSEFAASDLEAGNRLSDTLEAYNHGLSGVLPCQGASIYALTETSVLLGTATSLATVTPTQTGTPTPSATPTASQTAMLVRSTVTYQPVQATRTATQTNEPVQQQPSNTPVPPTEQPAPTWTPNPTATSTEKPIPTDTPEPTLPPPTPTLPIIPTLPN